MQRNDLRPLEDMFRRIVKPLSEPLTMSNDLAHLGEYAQPANTAYDMSPAQRRHVYEHYSYQRTVVSPRQGKPGTRAQGKMTFGCVGPGSITLVSGFRYFVLSAFRYFVFSVFTVSGIRSGEGIGSRPAVGCLARLSVAAADAATLRRAGLFRLMPVFTGFGFHYFGFRYLGKPVSRYLPVPVSWYVSSVLFL